jgi:ABC-type nitrate/sulfonate/bicarbonate transport system permease component
VKRIAPPLLTLIALLIGWELIIDQGSAIRVLPAPTAIFGALMRDSGLLLRDYIPITMLETVIGLLLSLLIGVITAALLDFSPLLRRALYPLLIVSQTIPLFALAPVLILLLGFGIEPKITIVVLFCAFPIAISTLDGLQSTLPEHLTLLESFGARRDQVWRLVRWPTALPGLFSGLRIAATYSVTGAIVGEYISPNAGIGKYMRTAYQSFRAEEAFGAAVIVILLSLLVVGVVVLLERFAVSWVFMRRGTDLNWNETN